MRAHLRDSVLAFILFFGFLSNAHAARLKVVTSLPDLAHAIEIIGGDEVEVTSLLKGQEDPHFADAVPEFIRQVSRADVVCVVGMDLEVGWIPKVLAKSGNAKVQPGGNGYCEAGRSVKALDVPTGSIDRSMGDVHPLGNPHYYLSPLSLAEAGTEITRVLSSVRPEAADKFNKGLETFRKDMASLHEKMSTRLKNGLINKRVFPMEYHKEFAYFFKDYGLKSFGSIEEKPGVPPSAGRLAQISTAAKTAGVTVALAAQHAPERSTNKFSELSGVSVKRVPVATSKDGTGAAPIEQLQTQLIDAVLAGARTAGPASPAPAGAAKK